MALQNSDIFVVQRQTGAGGLYRSSLLDLVDYVTSQPVLTYRGLINLTQEPSGQLDPDPPQVGDVYLNSTAGVLANGYTGLTAGDTVNVDDRLLFNGTQWQRIEQTEIEEVDGGIYAA